jgi:hypothetical protein
MLYNIFITRWNGIFLLYWALKISDEDLPEHFASSVVVEMNLHIYHLLMLKVHLISINTFPVIEELT